MLFLEKIFLWLFVAAAVLLAIDSTTPHVDRYWEMRNANHGRFLVKDGDKVGYINGRGRVVIPYQFEDGTGYFNNGLSPVKTKDGWTFVDIYGESHFPGSFTWVQPFSQGLSAAAIKQRREVLPRYGFIDNRGYDVIPFTYQQVRSFTSDGLAAVRVGQKWGFIDTKNTVVVSPEYKDVRDFHEGLAAVLEQDQWGYINRYGTHVIMPKFEDARDFSEGLAAVKQNGVWGYINPAGQFVVQPTYRDAYDFSEGLGLVKGLRGIGFVDQKGNLALQGSKFSDGKSFQEGFAAVQNHAGKWGFINTKGNVVISPRFDWVLDFKGGLARVGMDKNDIRRGYINSNGDLIWDPADWENSAYRSRIWSYTAIVMFVLYMMTLGLYRRKDKIVKKHAQPTSIS